MFKHYAEPVLLYSYKVNVNGTHHRIIQQGKSLRACKVFIKKYMLPSHNTYNSGIIDCNQCYLHYSLCFLVSQLIPVLCIAMVLALHIFARPYEKLRHNIMEAVILINYILLFLLRGTQTFLDNLSTYTGNQVCNS